MRNLLVTLVLFAIGFSGYSQYVDYERDGGWNVGFNVGGTWQEPEPFGSSKVLSKTYAGAGVGFTIGKSLYEKPGAFLSFDARFRYLHGKNCGWVGQPLYGAEYVDTLQNISFGFKNYQMQFDEFTIEGVVTLHALRERTGIIAYGFAGIGLTNYRVYADNYDRDGNLNDYTNIDTIQPAFQMGKQLRNESDLKFETTIVPTTIEFMPSLGFGLGYQFTPTFSAGLEHKITYALGDNIDGITGSGKNDCYHYTALTMRWNLLSGSDTYTENDNTEDTNNDDWSTNNNNTNNNTNTGNTTTTVSQNKPLVNIYNPTNNNKVVHNANYTLKAKIYHVSSANEISFTQNGLVNNSFTYNASTNEFSANVYLYPGNNSFKITGSNPYGKDSDSRIIIYKKEDGFSQAPPPVVTITNPSYSPYATASPQFSIVATVLNVVGKSNISMKVNGSTTTNFIYNTNNKILTANIGLQQGANTITITGSNSVGSDTKTVVINYKRQTQVQPPVVNFTRPKSSPYNSTSPVELVEATVLNVANKSAIKVLLNGSHVTNFTYNNNSKLVSLSVNLIVGANVIQVTGTNAAGSDTKTTTINYAPSEVMPLPVVDFTSPNVSPFNSTTSNITVKATALNITSKPYIKVTFNGSNISYFTYNSTTKTVVFNVNLIEGNNTFKITGTNSSGTDEDNQIIIYKKPITIAPPIVNIVYPNANPFNTTNATQLINAQIINVDQLSGVTAKLNGVAITNFTFDPVTDKFMYDAPLQEGANIIEIKGTNAAGVASKSQTIIYSKPIVVCDPPVLSFTMPQQLTKSSTTGQNSMTFNLNTSKGAIIGKVSGAKTLDFKINGVSSPGFNYDANSGKFESFLHLEPGANTYTIIATNDCGTVSQSFTFIYTVAEVPCEKPVVSYLSPTSATVNHTGAAMYSISANVLGLTSITQVKCNFNGKPQKMMFDPGSGSLSANVRLKTGNNKYSIVATNDCGTTTKDVTIVYAAPANPPTVTIVTPTTNPYTTSSTPVFVKATTTQIVNKNEVKILIEGQLISDFTFDNATKVITFYTNLAVGTHLINITVTNSNGVGKDSEEIIITAQGNPPTVAFTNLPPTTNKNPKVYDVMQAKVIGVVGNHVGATVVFKIDGSVVTANYNPNNGQFDMRVAFSKANQVKKVTVTASNSFGSNTTTAYLKYFRLTKGTGADNNIVHPNNNGTPQTSAKEQKEIEFNNIIQQADKSFNSRKYDNAYNYYYNALKLKPTSAHAKNRIIEIEKIKKAAKVESAYNSQIKKADLYLKAGKYATAKTYYTKAMGYKPNDAYAKKQIDYINKKLSEPVITKPTNNTHTKPVNNTHTKPSGTWTKPSNTTKPSGNSTKPTVTKPNTTTTPVVTKPQDTRPKETKPAVTKPADVKPIITKPIENGKKEIEKGAKELNTGKRGG